MTAITTAVLAPEARISPVEGLRNTATLAWRTLVQIKHNPFELLDFSVQPIMFLLLFTGVGLNTDLTKGVFDRLRSLPIARWSPLAGRIVADVVKQTWAVALLLGVGMILGFRIGTGPVEVLG